MNFDDLKNPDFQGRLQKTARPEDIFAIAREEGYELTDEELEGVAGGSWDSSATPECPNCGSTDVIDLGPHSMGDPNSGNS